MNVKMGLQRDEHVKKICIIIPVYKEKIAQEEKLSLISIKKNAPNIDIIYAAPEKKNISEYLCILDGRIKRFPSRYFKSENTYSKLLLTCEFYERFIDYEYILIIQTDALLLKRIDDKFNEFFQYDYVGAVWDPPVMATCISFKGISLWKKLFTPRKCYVGNGGFSLRNVKACIRLLKKKKIFTLIWNNGEDVFFAYHSMDEKIDFFMAPVNICEKFSVEKKKNLPQNIPYGVHAWKKYQLDKSLFNLNYS